MIRSIALQQVEVKDIGLKLFGSIVGPFLCIGITFAVFHELGKEPSLKEVSKIWHSGTLRTDAQFLRKILGIPSGPTLVLCLSFLKVENTISGVNSTLVSFKLGILHGRREAKAGHLLLSVVRRLQKTR